MKKKIGKYHVEAVGEKTQSGLWAGTAHYRWEEGGSTLTSKKIFDKEFDNEADAAQHALDQFALRVKNGDL